MPTVSNEQLLEVVEKAQVNTAAGGLVNPDEVDEFISMTIAQNALLQNVRVERNIQKALDIHAIDIGEPVLVSGVEGQNPDAADIHKPDFPVLRLKPVEAKAAFDITYSWLRQNIEAAPGAGQTNIENTANETLNAEYAKRVGKDLHILAFQGDTDNAGTSRKDKTLQITDGYTKQALADAGVQDYELPADPTYGGAGNVFSSMLSQLPKDYRDDRSQLAYYVSQNVLDAYEDEIANRQTTAADDVLFGERTISRYKRIQIIPIYNLPDDTIILTIKRNLTVGFGREMRMYQQAFHRRGVLEVTIYLDIDVGFLLGDALVLAQEAAV